MLQRIWTSFVINLIRTIVYYAYIFIGLLLFFTVINIIINFSNFSQFELLFLCLRIVEQKFHIIYETNFT